MRLSIRGTKAVSGTTPVRAHQSGGEHGAGTRTLPHEGARRGGTGVGQDGPEHFPEQRDKLKGQQGTNGNEVAYKYTVGLDFGVLEQSEQNNPLYKQIYGPKGPWERKDMDDRHQQPHIADVKQRDG